MDVSTTRFGTITATPQDILLFEQGLIGFEECKRWLLLADAENKSLGWLQSVDEAEIALAIVSPRRFVPDYELSVPWNQLDNLSIDSPEQAEVVVIVSRHPEGLCLNLKAPLVIHVESKTGCQTISSEDAPVRHLLGKPVVPAMAIAEFSSCNERKIA